MKKQRQHSTFHNRIRMLLGVVLAVGLLTVLFFRESGVAKALAIPADYGAEYGIENLEKLTEGVAFQGIIRQKGENTFLLQFTDSVNGLVTLARISQNSSLAGYTFQISHGQEIKLGVKKDGSGNAVSEGSFFGIGNETYPFEGTISIGGAQDVPVSMQGEDSWPYLFNNLSNKAKISSGGKKLFTYPAQIGNNGETASMALCKVLTVTEDGALDLSGFFFGDGLRVSDAGSVGLLAGEVKAGTGSTFSVDLSGCFPGNTYEVRSSNLHAGGIFGQVQSGVTVTIKLPDSFACTVSSGGQNKTGNVGILVGNNEGNVVIDGQNSGITLSGEVTGNASAGVIGSNEKGSSVTFLKDILVDGLKADALRVGGMAGTCKGQIAIQNLTVQNAQLIGKTGDVSAAGGVIGSVDLPAGIILTGGYSITLENNTIDGDVPIGGLYGQLSVNANIQNVTVTGLKVNSTAGTVGGLIGKVSNAQVTASDISGIELTMENATGGTIGGIIGTVSAEAGKSVAVTVTGTTLRFNIGNSTNAVVGGVVGKLTKGYLKAEGLNLNNSINCSANAGDVAGQVAAGAILDIHGLTVTESKGYILVAQTGPGSVVRLGGTLTNNSAEVLNLVYQQDASLIYLDGTYSGKNAKNNDIGNYGQVVRNDTLGIISLTGGHTVSIDSPLDASGEITLGSKADFAKLAITFHTKGSISGVTGATYEDLFGKTITLKDNIDLAGTGIEQLTPAKDVGTAFSGTLNGDEHTITLAIGQRMTDAAGSLQAGPNNEREYLGLFAKIQNATVQNLTLNGAVRGTVLPDTSSKTQYMGALAGYASGSVRLEGCSFNAEVLQNHSDSNRRYNLNIYMGGAVGQMTEVTALSVKGCIFSATVTDNCPDTKHNWNGGGLAGSIAYTGNGDIALTGNTISTKIEKQGTYKDVYIGGLVGKLTCTNYVTVDLGTSASDVSVTANGTITSGGILGNTFDKCHVIVDGAYSGTVSAGSASLGGLIHTLNGRMTVGENFTIGGTFTTTGEMKGLLLADGKNAWVAVKAVPKNYANVTAEGFDLFVGENIQVYTSVGVAAEGGIVTVETRDDVGKMPDSSNAWYTLMNARSNDKTRYYFNIEGLKTAIGSETDLLYWHVYYYAALPSYVCGEKFGTEVTDVSATADIDMTGYCFYPTKKEGVTVDFGGYTLTFGKTVSPTAKQFYGLQAGLLSDVTADGANATATIQNIKLSGSVAHLGEGNGSGALICGTVRGNRTSDDIYTLTLNIQNVVLNGIAVETEENYRPLMLNQLGSYVDATVSDISQGTYPESTKAASSLMGRGGYLENGTTPSSNVRMTLSNIVLEGKTDSTVFTKATLFYDVTYASGTGSFIYNFNLAEDWDAQGNPIHKVTYGAELSLNKDQLFYFDQDLPVRPDRKPAASDDFFKFQNSYLSYVYTVRDGEETNLLLSVNRKGAGFLDGWGTYEHPYIISSAKQLEYLANLLSNPNLTLSDGWKINFPRGNWASLSTLDLTACYVVKASGNELTYNGTELNRQVLLDYLAGAYYKLDDQAELTLSSNFAGIGSTYYPFHGVFHGNDGTVTMPGKTVDSNGYGFIRVANGCVVLKLTVVYSGEIILSGSNSFENAPATSAPTANTLTTGLPHFGGVIAWVVGGDNQIDTVTVTGTVTAGARHSVCGGYVGLISGGGVLLKNLTATTSFSKNNFQYYNNYVGRVLGGYAIAVDEKVDEKTYENGSDFSIPRIPLATLTSHQSGYAGNTFTLEGAQDLLLFSFGINSGAFAYDEGIAYGEDSRSRRGDYTKVGTQNPDGITLEAGKYGDDSQKTGIIADYFGVTSDLRNTNLTVRLNDTEYDMNGYANGFRGMSGVYANSPVFNINSFGTESGNATIILAMDMKQYAQGSGTSAIVEPDSIVAYGLFGRLNSDVTFQNLTLKGTASVLYLTTDNAELTSDPFTGSAKTDSRSVGGLLGRSQAAVTVNHVSLQDMEIVSPDIAGGFVGNHSAGNLTVTNGTANKTTIKGKRHAGGVVGFIGNGENAISNVQISDSIVETRVTGTATGKEYSGTGGIAGNMNGGTKLTVTDCVLTKTAVVFYCNFNSTSSNVGSGGLVGWTQKEFKATNCTVDGCVIFSVSNLSGSKFLYEEDNIDTDFLPPDLCDHLIYNGDNQKSAKILAYFLTQKNSGNYSIGAAGGILGVTMNNVTLTDCTISSAAAPTLIIAHNDAAGLIGEQRATISGPTVTLENCMVCTGTFDFYIVADTRAAGAVAYRSTNGTAVYKANQVRVVGSADYPVRIIQSVYSSTDAAGLFGELSPVKLTASNCQVSYCIIAGAKASAVYSTVGNSTITVNNIHVSNNLIYAKHKSYYAGGLFCYSSGNGPINVTGAYIGKNWILGTNGAGGVAGNSASKINASYLILNENVIRKVASVKISDYSFAVKSLETAYSALGTTVSFGNVGLIAGNNTGTITAIAVSCYAPDWGTTNAKNFGSGSGTVVYAAYGAGEKYGGFSVQAGDTTPQQIAIEAVRTTVTTGAGDLLTLSGDSVTPDTPSTLEAATWWLYEKNPLSGGSASMSTLAQESKNNSSVNGALPLLCLTEQADVTMTAYLNLLTGGGFSQAVTQGLVTITSQRYIVDADGGLTKQGGEGSVRYDDVQKKFVVDTYDNLEGDEKTEKTLTILTITFRDGSTKYSMHVALYYHRAVDLLTYVVPLPGEQYYLPSFRENPSYSLSVSYGDPFTLYVEYNYSDEANKLEGFSNFNKRIALTGPTGQGEGERFERNTVFVLIDLNASSAAGYAYYTLTQSQEPATNHINFEDFKRGENDFALPEILNLPSGIDRICTNGDYTVTERYLLVVFPVQNQTDPMAYNMVAEIDEEQRQSLNVTVKTDLSRKFAQVQVWPAPTMENEDPTGQGTISNQSGQSISMVVSRSVTFTSGYVSALNGQGSKLYESHTLQLRDAEKKIASLPAGTQVKVTQGENTVYESVLSNASSQISFSVGDILGRVNDDKYEPSYQITMDFSRVSETDFRNAFQKKKYYLEDTLYLSSTENVRGNIQTSATKEFNAEREEAKIKLAVVPEDNRYLGINLSKPDDITNSGKIDFTVSADFSALEKTFQNATLSFAVSKKVYNETDQKYVYTPLEGAEASIRKIQKEDAVITTDTLSVTENEAKGSYRLVVDLTDPPALELTNYKLTVTITATAVEDGQEHRTSDYFVFLICSLQTDPE